MKKLEKAKNIRGPKFLHIITPCPTGWGFPTDQTLEIGRLAVQTGLWYQAEYENGKVTINNDPKEFKPCADYFKKQKRFRHLTPEDIIEIEKHRDREWKILRNLANLGE